MRLVALLSVSLAVSGAPALADDVPAGAIEGRVEHRFVNELFPAAVYLEPIPGEEFEPPSEPVQMSQKDQVFSPRVLPVLAGTEVVFLNDDGVQHNVRSDPGCCQPFDLGDYGPGENRGIVTEAPGVLTITCRLHSSMIAYVIVLETPYFAVTGRGGKFEIPDVPPGEYRITFWHEKFVSQTKAVRVEPGGRAQVAFRDLVRR